MYFASHGSVSRCLQCEEELLWSKLWETLKFASKYSGLTKRNSKWWKFLEIGPNNEILTKVPQIFRPDPRESFFGQILYSIHCVFAVVWIKITLREANTYLTVKTVAMTMMGRRRMESRMGKRTTEGEAGEVFITVRRSSTQCSLRYPTQHLSF